MLAPHKMSTVAFSNFNEKLFPRECATSQRTAETDHCSNLEAVLKGRLKDKQGWGIQGHSSPRNIQTAIGSFPQDLFNLGNSLDLFL